MHRIATMVHLSRRAAGPLVLCLAFALSASACRPSSSKEGEASGERPEVASAVQAGPGRATAPPVKAANLPTWAEVDALYDHFEYGSRETSTDVSTSVLHGNCSTRDDGPKADAGRNALYYGASRSIPAWAGYEDPYVLTMSFATVEAAKEAFQAQRSWIKGCDGRTVHVPKETNSYLKVPLAGLGDQRVAYRHSLVLEPNRRSTRLYTNGLVFWVRSGRFLVDVEVRQASKRETPARAPLLTLAEIALARLP